ncbi:MAG: hypothetical protein RJA44_2470 [Pseudomonadota bacterium]
MTATFTLQRNAFGRLVCLDAAGTAHVGVVPVRAFPLAAPDEGLSIVSPDGHELVWVERLADLAPDQRALIEEELAVREFIPEIRRIVSVSTYATPSSWMVETDRGPTTLVLKVEEDIRRVERTRLLITSGHGLQFSVRDMTALDRHSRKILERFL